MEKSGAKNGTVFLNGENIFGLSLFGVGTPSALLVLTHRMCYSIQENSIGGDHVDKIHAKESATESKSSCPQQR